jgi:transcriptional regulator with XRE-family HTH domain
MQKSLGTFIRQLRREQNKTQTELGGSAFSKSYVSAVESDKLVPSAEALRHFARTLGKPEHYFLAFASQTTGQTSVSLMEALAVLEPETMASLLHEKVALLATLFDHPEYGELEMTATLFALQPEIIDALPSQDQAHYSFFQSLIFQRKKEYTAAIEALEQALVRESHPQHSLAILYALTRCYLLLRLPQMALNYALRSYRLVRQHPSMQQTSTLPCQIALQLGMILLALRHYELAAEYFGQARTLLHERQPMRDVEQIYRHLGYCACGLAYQKQTSQAGKEYNEVEHLFQQALGYFLQSRTIAQVTEDRLGEQSLRLAQARLQIDRVNWRRRCYKRGMAESQSSKELGQANLSSLLDEASEQCCEVLSAFQAGSLPLSSQQEKTEVLHNVYHALALLLQVSVQRALLAREQGYDGTFRRECSLAATLCQQALDACEQEELLETLTWKSTQLAEKASSVPALPRLPALPPQDEEGGEAVRQAQAELYFAAGEIAELLALTATTPSFIKDCYKNADASFLRALEELRKTHMQKPLDVSGALTGAYQRYTFLMEERFQQGNGHESDGYCETDLFFSVYQSHMLHSPDELPAAFLTVLRQSL